MISNPGRIVGTAFAGLLALLLGGCRSAHSYLDKGNVAFARAQFEEASLNYHKAIQKDANLGEAYYRAGLAELKQNKAMQALDDLRHAVQLMPDNSEAKTELTNLMLGAYIGDPKRPKFLYDLLLKSSSDWLARDPSSPQGLRIQGYIAMLEQRPDEAVDLLQRAHSSNPRDEKIADALMDALFRAGRVDQAEKVGWEFVATDKAASDIYDALFRIYLSSHRTEDAERALLRKIEANPQENSYLLQLAGFYAGLQNKPKMEETIHRFLANPGAAPGVHIDAGDFYASIGDLDDALAQYRAQSGHDANAKTVVQDRIARVLLLEKKNQEALNVLNSTIAQDPNDPEARALRGALLVSHPAAEKAKQGIDDLRTLLQNNPNDPFLKFLLARALAERQELAEARSRLQEVVKQRPQFVEAHLMLADIAFKQRDMTDAVQEADAALEVDPQNLKARMLKGSALRRQGRLEEAQSVLGALSRQAPQSVDVLLELAYVSLNRRSFSEAEAAFNKILASHPTEWRAVAGLVDTDLAQNRPDKAFARLDNELTRTHGAAAVRYLLASTALRSGNYNLAIENFRELANQTANSIDPYLQLANVYQLKGDVHDAILTLQKAAALEPKDARPGALLPFLLESENRAQEAKDVARRELAANPKSAIAMNNLAYLLAETGDSLDEAVKLARAAVDQAPNNPVFLDTLGYVYLKRDQNDDALEIFGRLIRRYPDDPACAYHTAIAWYQKGDRARAKALLSHALDLRPPKEIETGVNDLLNRMN